MAQVLHSPVSNLARVALWAAVTILLLTLVAKQHPGAEACELFYHKDLKEYCKGKPDFPDFVGSDFGRDVYCQDCEAADWKNFLFVTCGSGCDFFGNNCDVCRPPYTGVPPQNVHKLR